ncbi:hypothetical protein D9555_21035 [Shigella sonnei]|nr:hypothetical protein [Shigella sonnei]
MSKNLEFINDVDGRVLSDNAYDLTIAIIGDKKAKKDFIKAGHEDIDRLEYYLEASIDGLGESRTEEKSDLKIKDLNECLSFIKALSNEERIELAESLMNWFQHVSVIGAFKALSIVSSR